MKCTWGTLVVAAGLSITASNCKKSKLDGVSINGVPADAWLAKKEAEAQEERDNAPLPPAARTERTLEKYDLKLRGAVARPASSPFSWVRSMRIGCALSRGDAVLGCALARVGDSAFLLAQTPVDAEDWPQEKPMGEGREGVVATVTADGKLGWINYFLGAVPHAMRSAGAFAYVVGRVNYNDSTVGDAVVGVEGGDGFFRVRVDEKGKVTEPKTLPAKLESAVADVNAAGEAIFVGGDQVGDVLRVVATGMGKDGSQRFQTVLSTGDVPFTVDAVSFANGGSAVALWLPGGVPELAFLDTKGTVIQRAPTGQRAENLNASVLLSSWAKGAAIAFPVPDNDLATRVVLYGEGGDEIRRHDFAGPRGAAVRSLNESDGVLVVGLDMMGALTVDGREIVRETDELRAPFAFVFLDEGGPRVMPRYRGDNTYVSGVAAIRTKSGAVLALGESIGPLVVDEEVAIEGLKPGEGEAATGLRGKFLIATRAAP